MLQTLEAPRVSHKAAPLAVKKAMADLLYRVAHSRDAEAFQELYATYGPRVKAYMMRLGSDPAHAEDLAQETLMMVWRKAGLYSVEKGSAVTWIYTIARNLRIDRLRREVAWQPLPEGESYQEPSSEPLPDEQVLANQHRERVRAALAELPEEQSEVVVLSYIDGLSHSEIAERLGVPLGTVKSRMRLAYQKVRSALEDLAENED